MTTILNAIMFLRELIFGRVKALHRTRPQIVRSCIVIGILAISLYMNLVMTKSVYKSTARYIAVTKVLEDQGTMKSEISELKQRIHTYEIVLSQLNDLIPLPPGATMVAKPGPSKKAPDPEPVPVPAVILPQRNTSSRDEKKP